MLHGYLFHSNPQEPTSVAPVITSLLDTGSLKAENDRVVFDKADRSTGRGPSVYHACTCDPLYVMCITNIMGGCSFNVPTKCCR